jgi:hypothetical protein
MFQIICSECKNPNPFGMPVNRPVECSFCFTSFSSDLKAEEIKDENKGKLIGLKLIYQKTSELIEVKGDFNILGRANFGAALFLGIIVNGKSVISRKHCSISKLDDKYFLLDEGSTNGTFYGVNKITCFKSPQEIENNSLIFIGEEAFLVQYIYDEQHLQEKVEVKAEELKIPKKYRCKEGCGFESEALVEICPKCMASNSMVGVYE